MRIALCDDNRIFLDFERDIIDKYLSEHAVEHQCDMFLSGEELLSHEDEINKYDLFILDYSMAELTGFETAKRINSIFPGARIAFATNYYDFTREGYKYNAIRYLVKQDDIFKAELLECIEFVLKTDPKKTIMLELSDGILEVAVDDIAYIGSDKHYIEYFIKNREDTYYMRRCSLDDAIKELPGYFARVHRRFIVNLKNTMQIKDYNAIVKISENDTKAIPIARDRYDEIMRKFFLTKGEFGRTPM